MSEDGLSATSGDEPDRGDTPDIAPKLNHCSRCADDCIHDPPAEHELYAATIRGNLTKMSLAKTKGAAHFGKAFKFAAGHGQIDAMRSLWDWGLADCNHTAAEYVAAAFGRAAFSGEIGALELLRQWGATNYTSAMEMAVNNLQPDAIRWLYRHKSGNIDLNQMMHQAVSDDATTSMVMLKELGANNYADAMVTAAEFNSIGAMGLLYSWDPAAANISDLANTAIFHGFTDSLRLLNTWGVCDRASLTEALFNAAVAEARRIREPQYQDRPRKKIANLLAEFGADHNDAIGIAIRNESDEEWENVNMQPIIGILQQWQTSHKRKQQHELFVCMAVALTPLNLSLHEMLWLLEFVVPGDMPTEFLRMRIVSKIQQAIASCAE